MNTTTLDQFAKIVTRSWKWVLGLILVLLLLSWAWGFFNQGTLKLTVSPVPAQLIIGKQTDTLESNLEKRLPAGQYSLIIRKQGYLDYQTTVKIQSRQTTELKVTLIKTPQELLSSVKFPALSLDNSQIYFLGSDSKLYRFSIGGSKQLIDDLTLPDPPRLEWSPDRSRVLVSVLNRKFQLQQSGSPFYSAIDADQAVVTWIYDLSVRKLTKLGSDVASSTWSVDGRSIFFVSAGAPFSLNRISADGSGLQKIIDIKFSDVVISPSPDAKSLAWYAEPEGFGSSDIYLVNIASKSQQILTTDGYSVGATWSPSGDRLLIDRVATTDFKHSLTVLDLATRNRRDLGAAIQSEVALWSQDGDKIYGYNSLSRTISKVDLVTSQAADLIHFDKAAPANLQITSDESRLFYTVGDILYQLNLK